MLRPGFFVAGMPFNEVMTFVDDEYQIFALFNQNELHQVVAGQRSRDHARHVSGPHHQGPRRLDDLGAGARSARRVRQPAAHDASSRPRAGSRSSSSSARRTARCSLPPARAERRRSTRSTSRCVHIIRKVLLRVASYLDYVIIKHSISLATETTVMTTRRLSPLVARSRGDGPCRARGCGADLSAGVRVEDPARRRGHQGAGAAGMCSCPAQWTATGAGAGPVGGQLARRRSTTSS